MSSATATISIPTDSPEAQRYNRVKRWLGIADFVVELTLLVELLLTGWHVTMRDLAYRNAFQHYALSEYLYV